MNKKIIIILSVIIIIVFLLSFFLSKNKIDKAENVTDDISTESRKLEEQKIPANIKQSNPTSIPTPTYPPYSMKVQDVNDQYIIVSSEKGTLRLTNDPNKVKVFKRSGNQLVAESLSDVKIGQAVTVKAIIPGKESHLIIENP